MEKPLDYGSVPTVLDTQVVMDWLVFRDRSCLSLSLAVMQSRLNWCTTAKMYNELVHVLGRGVAIAWRPNLAMIAQSFERHAHVLKMEPPSARHLLRCRDSDDQMFLDLAIAVKARWLFSRDRAVLALAGRAREHGIEIISPLTWNKQEMATHFAAAEPLDAK